VRSIAIAMLLAAALTPAEATDAPPTVSLFQHRYLDCGETGAKGEPGPDCIVFYSVEPNRLVARLKDPQLADRVPTDFEKKFPQFRGGCRDGGDAAKPLLSLTAFDPKTPSTAEYKVRGCKSEPERLEIARKLRTLKNVEIAGLKAQKLTENATYLLVDDIIVETEIALPRPPSEEHKRLLAYAGWEYVRPDLFDPEFRALLRAHPGCFESPLDGLDALTEIGVGTRTDANPGDEERTTRKDAATVCSDKSLSKSLKEYQELKPRVVRPVLIPIGSVGDHEGFDAWRKAQKKTEDTATKTITLNSTSNTTDVQDRAAIAIGAEISEGSYPGAFRFKLDTNLRFEDGKIEDSVGTLLLNYDRYVRPWFEAYIFAEAFNNSFMGIDQRWEAGGGALIEWDARSRKRRDRFCEGRTAGRDGYRGDDVFLTRDAAMRLEQFRAHLRDAALRSTNSTVPTALEAEYCRLHPGIVKRNARFQASLALSVFSDFEEPDDFKLAATLIDPETLRPVDTEEMPAEETFSAPSRQTLRFTVRPRITFRPTDGVTLSAWHYYKFDPNPDDPFAGSSDWRSDTTVQLSFLLNDAKPKVLLTASWTEYRDSSPPRLSALEVFETFGLTTSALQPEVPTAEATEIFGLDAMGRDVRITGLSAQDQHEVVKFGVQLKF